MNTATRKAKGRRFQQKIAKILRTRFKLKEDDVVSRPMGSQGEDIMLSSVARKVLPYSFECKKHNSFSIYKLYEQAKSNSGKYTPVLVIEADRKEPLVILSLKDWIK